MAATQKASRPHALSQIQRLQTVAAETSNQLRNQTMQKMQNQAIRLEDVADTELEDTPDIERCMDELMQCILYTELRKDIRRVASALDDVHYRLFSSRQNTFVAPNGGLLHENESSTCGADDQQQSPPPNGTEATDTPREGAPESPKRDKLPQPAVADVSGGHLQPGIQTLTEAMAELEKLEKTLCEACLEVEEWRWTNCMHEFIGKVRSKDQSAAMSPRPPTTDRARSPSEDSARSVRSPVEQIILEARDRQRKRASSVNGCSRSPLQANREFDTSSLKLSASPPLSRLLQAEREAESMRLSPTGGSYSGSGGNPANCYSTGSDNNTYPSVSPTDPDAALSPSGAPLDRQLNSLRLIDDALANDDSPPSRHRTYADDVRIVGWETKGSGLDIHTEFKVVAHLTRGENLTVLRRYTDFVLLREVLCRRYSTFRKRIPHLPAKQAFGKFDDRFLKKRESGLQFFLAYVVLHPVIGTSSVIKKWFEGS